MHVAIIQYHGMTTKLYHHGTNTVLAFIERNPVMCYDIYISMFKYVMISNLDPVCHCHFLFSGRFCQML